MRLGLPVTEDDGVTCRRTSFPAALAAVYLIGVYHRKLERYWPSRDGKAHHLGQAGLKVKHD